MYVLKLYVTGHTVSSQQAIKKMRQICERELDREYEIQVIDVLENPKCVEDERILATPTVIKELPLPVRRIIGDLSNTEQVLVGLDIVSRDEVKGDEKK